MVLTARLLITWPWPSKAPRKQLVLLYPIGSNYWECSSVKKMLAASKTVVPV